MKIVILITVLLSSCAGYASKTSEYTVDPEFEPYVQEYLHIINSKHPKEGYYEEKIKNLPIHFDTLDEDTMGECNWGLFGDKNIKISKKQWNSVDFVGKQFLIYHELEHCVRGRVHTNIKKKPVYFWDYVEAFAEKIGLIKQKGFFADGCPSSIMYPYDTSTICNDRHYNDYIEEMANYE